jgi:hypothetical protein
MGVERRAVAGRAWLTQCRVKLGRHVRSENYCGNWQRGGPHHYIVPVKCENKGFDMLLGSSGCLERKLHFFLALSVAARRNMNVCMNNTHTQTSYLNLSALNFLLPVTTRFGYRTNVCVALYF